jgi:hypothetical protein
MNTSLQRLLELAGIKAPTIASATERSGNINRKTADRILDPRGYFEKNKRKNRRKMTEADVGTEMAHPTMPMPDRHGERVEYDNVRPMEDDQETATVVREPDGSYYGQTGKFDFEAADAEAMRAKLTKWGYTRLVYPVRIR